MKMLILGLTLLSLPMFFAWWAEIARRIFRRGGIPIRRRQSGLDQKCVVA